MGNVDHIVGYLAYSPSDLFSRSQVQLDSFTRVALKDAEYGRIRLEGALSCASKLEQATAAMMIPRRSE